MPNRSPVVGTVVGTPGLNRHQAYHWLEPHVALVFTAMLIALV